MSEDFAPFELAVKLREKGFREKCLAYYDVEDNVGLLYNTQYTDEALPCQYTDLLQSHNTGEAETQPDDSGNCVDAPTIPQVLKWLRKEKLILIGLSPMQEYDGDEVVEWCSTVYKADKQGGLSWKEEFYYQSYEQAALAGIEYVLDKLI